ncbi:MAG: hypothetical protein WCS43_00900 [Verrucomicrobiota bacterium]
MAFVLTVALVPCEVRAAGVAILKEQTFHRDSTAKPVAYRQIIYSSGPYLRIVSGNRNIDVLKSKLVNYIEVPDQMPPTIMEENDLADLRESLAEMRKFSKRYPLSAPYLESRIAVLSGHIARFDAGELRFEGDWMSRVELAKVLESRKTEAEMQRQHEIEQLVFDEAQKEKGLVLVHGNWVTEEQARKRLPTEHTELSNALWPLLSYDIEGARITLERLAILASRQNGAMKVRTERLHKVIKNLFLAELQLSKQIVASNAAAVKATEHERRATQWLKPNAFGTIQKDAARDSQNRAAALRNQADQQLAACRAELLNQLHEADIVTEDFHNLREHRVALMLGETVRIISSRNITAGEFRFSFPDESLAAIRNSITPP